MLTKLVALLLTAGAAIMGILGGLHLLLTFFGPKIKPRDPELVQLMSQSTLVITPDTTVWKAWIGFNASHSLGALLFAAVYVYLAQAHIELLLSSWFLRGLSLLALLSYLVLGIMYWFKVPLSGIALALALFVVGYGLAFADRSLGLMGGR